MKNNEIALLVVAFFAIFGLPFASLLLGRRSKKKIDRDEDDDDPPSTGGVAVPV